MAGLADAFVGQSVGGLWHLDELLGEGQFSSVYRATNGSETVALKMLHPNATRDPSIVLEFQTEAELLELLGQRQCANVIRLIEGASTGSIQMRLANGVVVPIDIQFHLLELAEGSLDELVADHAAMDWALRLDLFRDVVAGLHQMHRADVVHRDVKSSNVLLKPQRRAARAIVGDLGRSARLDQPARFSGGSYMFGRGDCSFAPPELLWGHGARSAGSFRHTDLYLLGSLLCELATGQAATAMLVPDWLAVRQHAELLSAADRVTAHNIHIAALRPQLASLVALVRDSAPSHIASELGELFAQLCDPEPSSRGRRTRKEVNLPSTDLAWLLRRVDILRKRHAICSRQQLLTRRGTIHALNS